MQGETIQVPELARAEARLARWMMVTACLGTLGAAVFGHGRVGLGFALGAAVGILNYFWLQQAIEALFDTAASQLPKRVVVKFAIRYPLAFAGIYLFYRTGWLPFLAVLAGLFVPLAGALVEAVIQIIEGWRYHEAD